MSHVIALADPSMLPTFALGLGLRATFLLAIALGTIWAAGPRRVLLRSAIGQAGLLGLLCLPVVALLLPPVEVACLPAGRGGRIAG